MDIIPLVCFGLGFGFVFLGTIIGLGMTFTKAGRPGWAAIVPIYNAYVLLKVAGKPGWWLILMFIPVVGLVIQILALKGLAEAFGKDMGFVMGLVLLPFIFIPVLGGGSAQYAGAR